MTTYGHGERTRRQSVLEWRRAPDRRNATRPRGNACKGRSCALAELGSRAGMARRGAGGGRERRALAQRARDRLARRDVGFAVDRGRLGGDGRSEAGAGDRGRDKQRRRARRRRPRGRRSAGETGRTRRARKIRGRGCAASFPAGHRLLSVRRAERRCPRSSTVRWRRRPDDMHRPFMHPCGARPVADTALDDILARDARH